MDDLTERWNVSTLRELAGERFKNNQFKEEIEFLDEKIVELEKENKELKNKLADIKYLNKDKVRDLIYKLLDKADIKGEQWCGDIIDEICGLAIPEIVKPQIITEDDIMGVLYNNVVVTIELDKKGNIKSGKGQVISETSFKKIAQAILQKAEKWESQGVVTITDKNIDNVGYWFKEYKNKRIEIAVKEVK